MLLNRHSEDVFQGFDLLLFGRIQHIGFSACFLESYRLSAGFDFYYLVEHIILVYRRSLSG